MTKPIKQPIITLAEIRSVDGLSSRAAGEILGRSKSTVNDARDFYRNQHAIPAPVGTSTAPKSEGESFHESWKGVEGEINAVVHEDITFENILRKFGHNPDLYKMEGVLEQTHWQYNGTDWNHRYKFKVRRVHEDELELPSILAQINNYVPTVVKQRNNSAATLVVCIADLQIGKVDWNGGTQDTVEQVLNSVARAVEIAASARYDEILLIDAGDIIENIYNTSSQLGTNDRDLPHQVEIASHVVLESIKMLAPLTNKLRYLAVPSNHGAQRLGKGSPAGDVHADYGIVIANMLSAALRLNPTAFGHVEVVTPAKGHESLYVESSGSQIGVVHGHQANNPGAITTWWKGQTHGGMPVGQARILIAGHYHSLRVEQSGDAKWLFVCPSSDRGSSWYTNKTGEASESGVLIFETFDNKWQNLEIV